MIDTNNQPQALYMKDHANNPDQVIGNVPSANIPSGFKKKSPKKLLGVDVRALLGVVALILVLVAGLAGVLISQKQRISKTAPVAPNAPESEPAAYVSKTATCTLTFDVGAVNPTPTTPRVTATSTPRPSPTITRQSPTPTRRPSVSPTPTRGPSPTPSRTPTPSSTPTPTATPAPSECGYTPCTDDNSCAGELVCVTANNGNNYCSLPQYRTACIASPSVASCCTAAPTATPTPAPSDCGYTPCSNDDDCTGSLVCIPASNGSNYCGYNEYRTACAANPSYSSCCTAPTVPTNTPVPGATNTPVPTLPPYVSPQPTGYIVVTTVQCNDTCSINSDCANVSHICYNGRCRLDVNPEDQYCRMPSGATTKYVETVYVAQELPAELPQTGPADWMNYLKVGLVALGVGALLLLFL
ncbi:MAG: LPXTG cell wall anchor domain-containing protein [Patescibacteria group bacterium]